MNGLWWITNWCELSSFTQVCWTTGHWILNSWAYCCQTHSEFSSCRKLSSSWVTSLLRLCLDSVTVLTLFSCIVWYLLTSSLMMGRHRRFTWTCDLRWPSSDQPQASCITSYVSVLYVCQTSSVWTSSHVCQAYVSYIHDKRFSWSTWVSIMKWSRCLMVLFAQRRWVVTSCCDVWTGRWLRQMSFYSRLCCWHA